jgi:hypothetical protein
MTNAVMSLLNMSCTSTDHNILNPEHASMKISMRPSALTGSRSPISSTYGRTRWRVSRSPGRRNHPSGNSVESYSVPQTRRKSITAMTVNGRKEDNCCRSLAAIRAHTNISSAITTLTAKAIRDPSPPSISVSSVTVPSLLSRWRSSRSFSVYSFDG